MNRQFSLYLDFLRWVAAAAVLVRHGTAPRFTGGVMPQFEYGHEAVLVFFVLSGYVISYVSREREKSPGTFLFKRLSRVYSVLIPAVVVSVIADSLGTWLNPSFYAGVASVWSVTDIVSTLLLLGENWTRHVYLGSNGVIWSLHYEVWYYLLFATLAFGGRFRYPLFLVAAILAGPRILALLPCWAFGVAAQRLPPGPIRKSGWLTLLTAGLSLAWIVTEPLKGWDMRSLFGIPLEGSSLFANDTVLALLISVHLIFVRAYFAEPRDWMALVPQPLRAFSARVIAQGAGTSFTLYMFHLPLLFLCGAALRFPLGSSWSVWGLMVFVYALCHGAGMVIEPRKSMIYDRLVFWFPRAAAPRKGAGTPT